MGTLRERIKNILDNMAEDERVGIRTGELMWYIDGGRSKYYEIVRVLEDFGVLKRINRGIYEINWMEAVTLADTPAVRRMAERMASELRMNVKERLRQISQAEVIG